jgi:hypothetical protein
MNNGDAPKAASLNVSAAADYEVPINAVPASECSGYSIYDVTVPADSSVSLDFVVKAHGTISPTQLKKLGTFDSNYAFVKDYYDGKLKRLALPVTLPNQEVVDSYKNTYLTMLETIVGVGEAEESADIPPSYDAYEIRGSGGNRSGFYQYDRFFSHDVPNMVEQFVRDGDFAAAMRIMGSAYYQSLAYAPEQDYLNAIPLYIIPYATMWLLMSDGQRIVYYTESVKSGIKAAVKNIHAYMTGPAGLMAKSNSLDNGSNYLVIDNFAVLHGFAAYEYLSTQWGWTEEIGWAQCQLTTMNNALNGKLDAFMAEQGVDWYYCGLDADTGFWTRHQIGDPIYDGNWIGTTFMMSTFPWDAVLLGFDLGGTWETQLDKTIDNAFALRAQGGAIPEDSWGGWWGHFYGAVYNTGMSLSLLYSDKYRELTVRSYEWLLDNQSAPFQWGESFDKGQNDTDWTTPATDYETWGLGFMRQGLLEATVSVKVNGDVIIGRGIPNNWLVIGKPILWQNIGIGNGKHFDSLKISAVDETHIQLDLVGDDAVGDIVFNLPIFKDNIKKVCVGIDTITEGIDRKAGTITLEGSRKSVMVWLGKD